MDVCLLAAAYQAVPVVDDFFNRLPVPHLWCIEIFGVAMNCRNHRTDEDLRITESSDEDSWGRRSCDCLRTHQARSMPCKSLHLSQYRALRLSAKQFGSSTCQAHLGAGSFDDNTC